MPCRNWRSLWRPRNFPQMPTLCTRNSGRRFLPAKKGRGPPAISIWTSSARWLRPGLGEPSLNCPDLCLIRQTGRNKGAESRLHLKVHNGRFKIGVRIAILTVVSDSAAESLVPDHLLSPVRDMGALGGTPLRGVEDLFLGSVFCPVNDLRRIAA